MLLKQGHLCKLVKSAIRKICAVRKATTPKVKIQESTEFKFEKLFDKKAENCDEPNTIDCVNFHMSGFNPSMKELMEGLVYSPSGRYAVNFQKSLGKIKGIFILDTNSMKFNMYESTNPENDLFLKMDICYWYGEECLVFIQGNCRAKKFYQTPIVLNHVKNTFELRETGVCDMDSAATSYAIPHRPNSNLKIKRFLILVDDASITREMSRMIEKPECGHSYHNLQIITNDNIAYFPCHRTGTYHDNNDKQILGRYMAFDFEKMVDVYDSLIDENNTNTVFRLFENQRDAKIVVEIVPNDITAINPENYLKTPGIHRKLGNLFISLNRKVAICLTPFNIVYGHQISETKIHCRTVPLPTGNQLLSLKESTMRRTYLNKKW